MGTITNRHQIIVLVVSFLVFGAFVLSISEAAYSGIGGIIPGCCQRPGQCGISTEKACTDTRGEWCQGGTCNEATDQCECPTCKLTIIKAGSGISGFEFPFELRISGDIIPFSLPEKDSNMIMFEDIPVGPTITIEELTEQISSFCLCQSINCVTNEIEAECFDKIDSQIQCMCGSTEDIITCTFLNICQLPPPTPAPSPTATPSPTPSPTSSPTPTPAEFEPGDANGDGEINILDVTALLNHIPVISSASGNGDCNEDGQVNILDVTCVLNLILGF